MIEANHLKKSFGKNEVLKDISFSVEKAADGFIFASPYPYALDEFVEKVVPLLQAKGIYRKEYEGTTLRENLGLELRIKEAMK